MWDRERLLPLYIEQEVAMSCFCEKVPDPNCRDLHSCPACIKKNAELYKKTLMEMPEDDIESYMECIRCHWAPEDLKGKKMPDNPCTANCSGRCRDEQFKQYGINLKTIIRRVRKNGTRKEISDKA